MTVLTTAVALARQFIRWWLAELAGLVPQSLRRLRGGAARHTPFRADQAYFAYRRLAQGGSPGHLRVEIAAVSRAAVEEALEVAAALGLEANRIDLAGAQPNTAPSDALLIGDRLSIPDRPS